ncbi:hypothetical protein [Corallococcus interemptor]|uniref:hypothetical protein n=1 Tax=Corallococcus interemptor TaxID=2316720 RepID=UPI0011C44FFC|nr:hypothetical protein [Corallococcus interemptor]
MLVRLFGFSLDCGQGITLDEFINELQTQTGRTEGIAGYNRIIYSKTKTSSGEKYQVGLLLTIKDQRRYCELQRNGKTFSISVREIEEGRNLIDFNYFIINHKTGRGLYQHYFNSCALSRFTSFCSKIYEDLRDRKISEKIQEAGGDTIAESQKRAIRKDFKGSLASQQMVRPGELDELINELEKIKSFEFDLAVVEADPQMFQPVQNFIKKRKFKLSFDQEQGPINRLRRGILQIVEAQNPDKGSITGEDATGEERILKLTNNFSSFGDYEFDDIAREMRFDLEDFDKSDMIKRMLKTIGQQRDVFDAPTP